MTSLTSDASAGTSTDGLTSRISIPVIILAAGEAKRMGGPLKQIMPFQNVPFLKRIIDMLRDAGAVDILVVLGCRSDEVRRAIDLRRVTVVENHDWKTGMFSSLQAGIRAVPAGTPGVMVTLADLPAIRPETCRILADCWSRDPSRIVLPVQGNHRAHPVIFPRSLFPVILESQHPDGPRGIVHDHAALVREIPVEDPGCTMDIDTPEDLEVIAGGNHVR